jgi:hypothetical protein
MIGTPSWVATNREVCFAANNDWLEMFMSAVSTKP